MQQLDFGGYYYLFDVFSCKLKAELVDWNQEGEKSMPEFAEPI